MLTLLLPEIVFSIPFDRTFDTSFFQYIVRLLFAHFSQGLVPLLNNGGQVSCSKNVVWTTNRTIYNQSILHNISSSSLLDTFLLLLLFFLFKNIDLILCCVDFTIDFIALGFVAVALIYVPLARQRLSYLTSPDTMFLTLGASSNLVYCVQVFVRNF